MHIELQQAAGASQWREARRLIEAYAASLPIDLAFQNLSHELAHLDDGYAPPRGAFLLAWPVPGDADRREEGVIAGDGGDGGHGGDGGDGGDRGVLPASPTWAGRPSLGAPGASGGGVDPVAGQAWGCIGLRPLTDEDGEIKRLYVAPAARGHGVGRLLIERVIDAGRRAGYRRLLLDTLPSMSAAVGLYRSLGFAPIAPYCFNPVPDALFLALDLA